MSFADEPYSILTDKREAQNYLHIKDLSGNEALPGSHLDPLSGPTSRNLRKNVNT